MSPTESRNRGKLRYSLLTGVGGIGTGLFFELEGNHTLGRNESRPGRLLPVRDYCKLHIIAHYVAVLLGAGGGRFRVLPIGKVGDDERAEKLRREMQQAGMDIRYVQTAAGKPTLMGVCFQYPDGAGGNIMTNESAASLLRVEDVAFAEGEIADAGKACIALAAPEVPLAARLQLLTIAGKHGALRAASLTSAEVEEAFEIGLFEQVDLLSINEDEAGAIAGPSFDGSSVDELLDELARKLIDRQHEMKITVSFGPRGTYAYEDGSWGFCPAAEVDVAGTAGAGDALLAGLLVGLAWGLELTCAGPTRERIADAPLESALDLAVLLAAFTVTSPHTIHPETDGPALLKFAGRLGIELSDQISNVLTA